MATTPAGSAESLRRREVEGNRLEVSGYLFGKDFPEVEEQMRRSHAGTMGMSYELADAHVADLNAAIWTLTRAIFTGAAILLREKATYRETSFQLAAKRCRATGLAAKASPGRTCAQRTRRMDERNTWQQGKGKDARWR
jgi:hypothetical protein